MNYLYLRVARDPWQRLIKMSKKKKLILEWEDDTSENYILGIVSSSSHLSFVHFLNSTDYFNFERDAEFEVESNSDKSYFISFTNNDTEGNNSYRLIKNKGTKGILSKEFKGLDYILIPSPENLEPILSVKEMLFKQKFVQAIIEIEIQKISDKIRNLLYF